MRDFIERAWNSGDEAVFEETLLPDFAHPGGREGFKAMVLGFRSAFPDFVLEVQDMVGVGEQVVTRFTMRGTHQGEFLGIAPTGHSVEFDGIAIDVMRDGQRFDGWAQLDRLGLLVQLGVVDPPQPDRPSLLLPSLRPRTANPAADRVKQQQSKPAVLKWTTRVGSPPLMVERRARV